MTSISIHSTNSYLHPLRLFTFKENILFVLAQAINLLFAINNFMFRIENYAYRKIIQQD